MSDDPHYKREQAKYENPVASREHLLTLFKNQHPDLAPRPATRSAQSERTRL